MASMRPDSFFRGRTATSTPLQRSSVGSSGQEETVVVTSREVNSLMDSNASILNKIKDQAKVLDAVTKTQKEILKVIAEINEKIDEFEPPEHEADQDDKLPPLLSSQVHLVYSQLTENEAFKPQESLISAHNASVRQFLEEQISAKEGGFSKRQIKKAVSRYYETKRKQYLQGLPRNQERTERTLEVNKLRSRRKRLYNSRVKVADGEDAESIKSLTYEYVSDEEDGEGDDEGKWVVRPPAWRSREASDLMQRLQAKVDRLNKRPKVFRVRGDNSDRGRPSATTTWAVRRVASTPTKSPGTSRNASTPTSSQEPSRNASTRSPGQSRQASHRSRSPAVTSRQASNRSRSPAVTSRRVATQSRSPAPPKTPTRSSSRYDQTTPPRVQHMARRRVAIDPDMSPTTAVRRAVLSPTPSPTSSPERIVSRGRSRSPSPSPVQRQKSRSASPVFPTISTPTSSINRLGKNNQRTSSNKGKKGKKIATKNS